MFDLLLLGLISVALIVSVLITSAIDKLRGRT